MSYKRKTIERYKFDFVIIVIATLLVAQLPRVISEAFAKEPMLSPLAETTIYIDRPVDFGETDQAPRDYSKQAILAYIVDVFGENADDAITIIRKCENSTFNATATNWNRNGTWDTGIFQINQVHGYTLEQMQDPYQNIDAAKKIFDNRGWTAWACSRVVGVRSFWE